jgi:hypothetical protein
MRIVEAVVGILLLGLGGVILVKRDRVNEFSYRIWTVPTDFRDPPHWLRITSTYLTALLAAALGAWLVVLAF